MKHKLMFLCVALNSILFGVTNAGELSEASKKIQQAYQAYQYASGSQSAQQDFLAAFPKTAASFTKAFNSSAKDQLFDGNRQIFALRRLSVQLPSETFQLLVGLAAQINWEPGAPSYLQHVLMTVAVDNPFTFAKVLQQHSMAQRSRVAKFLASGKSGPALGHAQLRKSLEHIGHERLADELLAALAKK
ncbi:hypothetical protein ACUR5C_01010 [Aliikangiella sp. IMCC44653]